MTKIEAIQKAYGRHWGIVKGHIDFYGWCPVGNIHPDIMVHETPIEFLDKGKYWRPTLLRGIEDNNGWIKIEKGERFPADIDYVWGLFEDGHIISTYVSGSMNSGFTHYQHISKPKLPIY